ncbi:MAG: glycosyltransferase family 39 protein [Polyangiaceae bacterium]
MTRKTSRQGAGSRESRGRQSRGTAKSSNPDVTFVETTETDRADAPLTSVATRETDRADAPLTSVATRETDRADAPLTSVATRETDRADAPLTSVATRETAHTANVSDDGMETDHLLPPKTPYDDEGIPLQPWPGLAIFGLGAVIAFLLMSHDGQLPFGIPLGAMACAVASLGLVATFGSFVPHPTMAIRAARSELGSTLAGFTLALAFFVIATRSIVHGTLPGGATAAALLLPGLLAIAAIQLYRVFDAVRASPGASTVFSHPSLWLVLLTLAVYAPCLGSFSLIDPWETHYGEVAREILARDDWMTLWWAQDGFFWSKPVLDFWLQALSFALFGVRHAPDAMLASIATGHEPYPEWAARLPMLLLSLVGQLTLYAGARAYIGKRAAFLGSVVLVAVPHYALIVHQSMTDLPYIATLMAAVGLVLLGLHTENDAVVTGYRIPMGRRTIVLSAHGLLLGTVVLFALPQILYLVSRNVGLVATGSDPGFYFHPDRFFAGSGGGNCGLPGNELCRLRDAANSTPQPSLCALIWTLLLAAVLFSLRNERRKKEIYHLGAWLFIALSALAKGLPGPVMFVGTVLAVLAVTRRFSETFRMSLPAALTIFAVIALPWFVQSTVRHGPAFLERLFVHDMYKRAFEHVHDTNTGDDVSLRYYLWQLGYGLFPATGVVTVGALSALGGTDERSPRSRILFTTLTLWFLVGFGMFSLTLTKFHHYIIPVVPAACLLAGPLLEQLLDGLRLPFARTRTIKRTRPRYDFLLVGVVAACVVGFAGLDLFGPSPPPGGAARLINLVTYNYARPWPPHLDFSRELTAFTVVAVLACLGLMLPKVPRAIATLSLLVLCLTFATWLCDRYLPRVAPHWGQRETIATYYRTRNGPEQPLVAYQMNWKGENFYTGNRIATFISTGDRFKQWVKQQRQVGKTVLFFTLEHQRLGSLKSELGQVQNFEVLTDKTLNNKFTLVRVTL